MKSIIASYPPKKYYFTGEFEIIFQGHYKAVRNKVKKKVPVYRSEDGEIILNMMEAEKIT